MGHDAALEAHEHAEHAEHAAHEHDPFISRVAISVAVLAVCAAVAGSLETVEGGRALGSTSEAVLKQDQATDSWNEFQADSIKKHLYTIAANGGGAKVDDYKKNAKEYGNTQDKLREKAEDNEKDRDRLLAESAMHEGRHHWLTGAATLFEIGIAMSTVAIITHRAWLWYTAVGFGVVGLGLLASAYVG
ncbi:MAG TPA: DUF4337 domain-containing protein [Rhizomicrobium sp.]|jgi:hypothetical protein|nr:DUF4337 domain-containing protein [Rhizomicrobium sp.]